MYEVQRITKHIPNLIESNAMNYCLGNFVRYIYELFVRNDFMKIGLNTDFIELEISDGLTRCLTTNITLFGWHLSTMELDRGKKTENFINIFDIFLSIIYTRARILECC